ncbi:MAG: Cobalt-precorrin-2 C(20)-methyltransferase [Dehalococcoidia bacterium]|nr:Cobalt-precorrin-2 C(20)-methyltransferase [Bacillota bacterium]
MSGIFYGIGVGPGDPELLTIKAAQVLSQVDAVIAPRGEKAEDSIALAIARHYLKEGAQVTRLTFPMVSDQQELNRAWEENKDIILNLLVKGQKVAFLTLGDPMLFSTYIYIFRLLRDSGYPLVTIPGITSFSHLASRLGIPLTEKDETLTIVPATAGEEILDRVLDCSGNLVLMKVYRSLPVIVEKLKKSGHLENAVMVSKCGWDDEEIYYDLEKIQGDRIHYLSTIIAKKKWR